MTNLSIDIYSDVMCPWCIIGYRNLLKALDELEGEIEVETRWRPFELNPDMPPEGEERLEHIARKYGRTIDQARVGAAQMQERAEHPIAGAAASAGSIAGGLRKGLLTPESAADRIEKEIKKALYDFIRIDKGHYR